MELSNCSTQSSITESRLKAARASQAIGAWLTKGLGISKSRAETRSRASSRTATEVLNLPFSNNALRPSIAMLVGSMCASIRLKHIFKSRVASAIAAEGGRQPRLGISLPVPGQDVLPSARFAALSVCDPMRAVRPRTPIGDYPILPKTVPKQPVAGSSQELSMRLGNTTGCGGSGVYRGCGNLGRGPGRRTYGDRHRSRT